MAIPPEPIQELLPQAALIVEAAVSAVLEQGPNPIPSNAAVGHTSKGSKVGWQRVALSDVRLIKGTLPSLDDAGNLVVRKPTAAYALREGAKGAFLLAADVESGDWIILGRYGPDTYRVATIEKAVEHFS